jgi:hypothetical protein
MTGAVEKSPWKDTLHQPEAEYCGKPSVQSHGWRAAITGAGVSVRDEPTNRGASGGAWPRAHIADNREVEPQSHGHATSGTAGSRSRPVDHRRWRQDVEPLAPSRALPSPAAGYRCARRRGATRLSAVVINARVGEPSARMSSACRGVRTASRQGRTSKV